jgi:hypothetical protein
MAKGSKSRAESGSLCRRALQVKNPVKYLRYRTRRGKDGLQLLTSFSLPE